MCVCVCCIFVEWLRIGSDKMATHSVLLGRLAPSPIFDAWPTVWHVRPSKYVPAKHIAVQIIVKSNGQYGILLASIASATVRSGRLNETFRKNSNWFEFAIFFFSLSLLCNANFSTPTDSLDRTLTQMVSKRAEIDDIGYLRIEFIWLLSPSCSVYGPRSCQLNSVFNSLERHIFGMGVIAVWRRLDSWLFPILTHGMQCWQLTFSYLL